MLPVASCCQKEEIPTKFIMFPIIAKIKIPTTVPIIPPLPPLILVPPSTTAEMHVIKNAVPMSALAVATRETWIFPAMQHITEHIIYEKNNTLVVLIPENRDATILFPIA